MFHFAGIIRIKMVSGFIYFFLNFLQKFFRLKALPFRPDPKIHPSSALRMKKGKPVGAQRHFFYLQLL